LYFIPQPLLVLVIGFTCIERDWENNEQRRQIGR
jgi:hypothetical protein